VVTSLDSSSAVAQALSDQGVQVLRVPPSAEGRIDFSDMLHRAADILESGTNPLPKFEHVLVDEFQDTSAAMGVAVLGTIVAGTSISP